MRSTKFRWLTALVLLAFGFVQVYGSGIAPSAYQLIMQAGAGLARRNTVNFAGAGVTCVDNPGLGRTDCTVAGGGVSGEYMFSATGSATNAAAIEATVIGAGGGSLTAPANYFSPAGGQLLIHASGYYSTPIGPGTLRVRLRVGAAVALDTGAFVPMPSVTNGVWTLDAQVVSRTVGVGGTVMTQAHFRPDVGVPVGQDWPMLNTAAVALDTTIPNAVNLTAEWSAAGGETITGTNFLMYGVVGGGAPTIEVGERYSWALCLGTDCAVEATISNAVLVARTVTVSACYAKAKTAPAGADLNIVIKRNGASNIFNTDLTIPDGSTAVATEIGMSAAAALTAGQYLTLDITQVGVGVKGKDVSVVCIGN